MRRNLMSSLKPHVRFSDLVDVPDITPSDSETPYSGDEGEAVVVSDDGKSLTIDTKKYDVAGFYPGTPSNSAVMLMFTFPSRVAFAAGLSGSQIGCGTAPGSGNQTFSFQRNGVEFATGTINNGATSGTFTMASNTVFAIGDVLKMVAPASVDGAIEDIHFTLNGEKKLTGGS